MMSNASAPTLLLVEDTVSIRKLLATVLGMAKYRVIEAEDGQAALACLQECTPELILTDISMPNMDGRALLKWVKSTPAFASVPVVFLSADFDAALERELTSQGAVRLLQKTGRHSDLIAAVGEILGRTKPS